MAMSEAEVQTINAESFASLDAVPMCISVVSYALPSRNLWANATYLRCASASLADFQALVSSIASQGPVLLPPRCQALLWAQQHCHVSQGQHLHMPPRRTVVKQWVFVSCLHLLARMAPC